LSGVARWQTYHRQVERLRERRDRIAVRRLDVVLLATAALLILFTLTLLLDPSFSFALIGPDLDAALNALTVLAAGTLAGLALARYRESGRISGLFQSSAFLLMAWVALLSVAAGIFRVQGGFGLSLASPEQLPIYILAISRVVGAYILLVGGAAAIGLVNRQPRVRRTLLAPIVAVTAAIAILYAIRLLIDGFNDLIPPFIGPAGIQSLIEDPRSPGPLPDVTGVALIIQAATASIFLVGALLYRRSYLRNGPVFDGYLAVALLIAAFAEIHFYFYPVVYVSFVTSADALRLVFFVVLLLGINAESRSDMRALRSAYAALDRLRLSEAERATLEERTRLARELHDGLAQDLWFAKLKHERLVPFVPDEQRALASEVTAAIDSAIAEAKQAVVTMRAAEERERTLEELITRAVDDFAGRSGVRADLSAADLPETLEPRTQVEVVRILQEALTNVRKHADATVVRVSAEVAGGNLRIAVIDNGRGFRPEETSGEGLGVQGMKERARLLGGDLFVSSEPSGGTAVELEVPLPK
jgi:signal transduction histidine kinase